jgi:hypothetical protein
MGNSGVAQLAGTRFNDGDEVWVPVADVRQTCPQFETVHGGAVTSGVLAGRVAGEIQPGVARSWYVDIPGLDEPLVVSSRKFRRHVKILILRVGDWDTEQTTLNPLAASLRAQLSLLLPPGAVDTEYVRSIDEVGGALRVHGGGLDQAGHRQAEPWGYAILVGHGRTEPSPGVQFGYTWHSPEDIANAMDGLGPGRSSFSDARFISLCCETGQPEFAEPFSGSLHTTWVGPSEAVHAFEAGAFVVRLFFEHFLQARTWADAFRHTRAASTSFSTQFRCWANGDEVQPL